VRFPLKIAFLLLIIAAFEFYPIVSGKIPLPINKVNQFPVYDSVFKGRYGVVAGPDNGDLSTQIYPWRMFAAQAIRDQTLPLWNPRILSGAPFVANSQSALFYPPNALFHVLPVHVAWTIVILLELILSGCFTALFVRTIGATGWGAAFAGVAFSFSGFMTAFRGYPMEDAAVWLPLILWCIERLRAEPTSPRLAASAVALAMPLLAGHPETAAHIYLLAGIYALFRSQAGRRTRFLSASAGAILLGVGLAAIQVVPTLEWAVSTPLAQKQTWPPRPPHESFAIFSRDMLSSPNAAQVHIPEGAVYAGMITLLLATWSMVHRDRRMVLFWAGVVLFSAGVAYGVEPLFTLFSSIPVMGTLKNSRLLLLVNFSLAVLAGFGVSTAVDDEEIRKTRGPRMLLLAAVTFGCVIAILILRTFVVADAGRLRSPSGTAAFLLVAAIPLAARSLTWIRCRAFGIACVCIVAIDLLTASHGYLPLASSDEIFPAAPAFRFLQERIGSKGHRVMATKDPYAVNVETAYRISTAGGYDVPLVRSLRFISGYLEADIGGFVASPEKIGKLKDRRLDLLAVRYIVVMDRDMTLFNNLSERFEPIFSDGSVRILENRTSLERAFFVPAAGIQVTAEDEAQIEQLSDPTFDPEKSVVLAERPTFSGVASSSAKTKILEFGQTTNEIRVRADVNEPGILVVSETHFPGWIATSNGAPVQVLRADFTLLGVPLEPGSHELTLTYSPRSFKAGVFLSLLSCIVVVVAARFRTHL